jgi:hypothetical protein
MWTTYRQSALGWLMMATLFVVEPVSGQHDDSAMLYGEGVQAYFHGDCSRAEQYLSGALEAASDDPRTYYFRALSLLRQGRIAEARGDMMVGAALEAQRPGRYPVGEALIRVQGHDRLLLEKFRRQARLDAAGSTSASMPYSPSESAAQRKQVVIPLEEYLRPGNPRPAAHRVTAPPPRTFAPSGEPPATDVRSRNPFRDDPQSPAAPPPVLPPPPSQPVPSETPPVDSEDPFPEAAEGAAGDASVPPPTTPEAESPPAVDEVDPFRGL